MFLSLLNPLKIRLRPLFPVVLTSHVDYSCYTPREGSCVNMPKIVACFQPFFF